MNNLTAYVNADENINRRAFSNIIGGLELWKHTDVKKEVRLNELFRVSEIIEMILLSMNIADSDTDENSLQNIMLRVLLKTNHDITLAMKGQPVNFTEHVIFFRVVVTALT